jgi:hypothetical protein
MQLFSRFSVTALQQTVIRECERSFWGATQIGDQDAVATSISFKLSDCRVFRDRNRSGRWLEASQDNDALVPGFAFWFDVNCDPAILDVLVQRHFKPVANNVRVSYGHSSWNDKMKFNEDDAARARVRKSWTSRAPVASFDMISRILSSVRRQQCLVGCDVRLDLPDALPESLSRALCGVVGPSSRCSVASTATPK